MLISRSPHLKKLSTLPLITGICLVSPGHVIAQTSLEEVVVTAQRRIESVLDVPITVKVISGEDLTNAGVSGTTELTQTVPAFRFDNNGAFSQPSIRGVGTALANVGGGSAVGIYVDGFLVPSPLSSDFSFLNVSGVEVLKGPQGTLFGRNTTAGAVLVSTSDPSFETKIKANASYANYNQSTASFYGSTGFTDTLAVDLAVIHKQGDGFVKDIVSGRDDVGENEFDAHRLGILFNPTDDLSLLFRYSKSRNDDPKSYMFGAIANQDDALGDLAFGALIPGAVYGTKQGQVALNDSKVFYEAKVENYTLTAELDLGWASLTSRTMYRNQHVNQAVDLDSTNVNLLLADLPNNDKTKTQELLLSSDSGRLEWVTGVFWMNEVNTQDFFLRSPPAGLSTPVKLYSLESEITSYAAFGDATYEVVDDLYFVFGVRYSKEKNEGFWNNVLGKVNVEDEWEDVSPRFVARYQLSPDSSVYASWSKGFKAGLMDVNGFNSDPIDPEEIKAYEVGFKTQDSNTRLEASAFYYDYKDLQVSSYVGTYSFTTNAASTEVYGGEVSFLHQFTDSFNLAGGIGYTHGRYDSYPEAPYHERNFTPPANPLVDPPVGSFIYTNRDAGGNQMQRAPEWTGNLTATYLTSVADGELELNGNIFYTDKVYFDPANQYYEDSYALLNLRASWTEPSGHWTFSIFGNNVTNEEYISQVLSGPMAAQQAYGDPAVYGVSIAYQN